MEFKKKNLKNERRLYIMSLHTNINSNDVKSWFTDHFKESKALHTYHVPDSEREFQIFEEPLQIESLSRLIKTFSLVIGRNVMQHMFVDWECLVCPRGLLLKKEWLEELQVCLLLLN